MKDPAVRRTGQHEFRPFIRPAPDAENGPRAERRDTRAG
jgi:hypothetical protein